MDVLNQIATSKLVSPRTSRPLAVSDDAAWLLTDDESERYPLLHGRVPVLLADREEAGRYVDASPRMVAEYRPETLERRASPVARLKATLLQDHRSEASKAAFRRTFEPPDAGPGADPLFLSVGGGPQRPHPLLTNLNIGPFPNVDLVADAHVLPYAEGCVDAIYCEAVLEHLQDPTGAVEEMHRVLRPGGLVFAATPFLQAYHGYPHHYQNFTLTGHRSVFEAGGFEVVEAGTCVGPVYTLVSLFSNFLNEYAPEPLRTPAKLLWGLTGALLRPLDRVLNRRESSHLLASTTYLVARKP